MEVTTLKVAEKLYSMPRELMHRHESGLLGSKEPANQLVAYRLVWATNLWLAATGTIAGSYSFGILFLLSKVSCNNSHVNPKIFITIAHSYSCYSWQL